MKAHMGIEEEEDWRNKLAATYCRNCSKLKLKPVLKTRSVSKVENVSDWQKVVTNETVRYELNDYMEQSPSFEAKSHSATQEITRF
jgi:hypothetical protein